MGLVDSAVLAIIGISVLLSIWRGAVREVLALAAWVFAFLAAQEYAPVAAMYMPASIVNGSLRLLAAFVSIFLVVLLATGLVAFLLARLLRSAGLGPLDRGLGAVFGLARGILVVMILVLLCGLTAFPRTPAWLNARLSPALEEAVAALKPLLPEELARRITFD
jgi:membrane protein required for colicin V production